MVFKILVPQARYKTFHVDIFFKVTFFNSLYYKELSSTQKYSFFFVIFHIWHDPCYIVSVSGINQNPDADMGCQPREQEKPERLSA